MEDAQIKQLKTDSQILHSDAQHVSKPIRAMLASEFLEKPSFSRSIYAIKSRVKPDHDIAQKVIRKRALASINNTPNHLNYDVKKITDAAGFRIVTLYQNAIPSVFEHLLRVMLQDPDGKTCFFGIDSIKEIAPFSSRPDGDPLAIDQEIVEIVRRLGLEGRIDEDRPSFTGYSSIHVVGNALVDKKRCYVEIQIRSVFEDAWAEISHKVNYATGRGALILRPNLYFEAEAPELNVLKVMADACVQQSDVICDDLMANDYRSQSAGYKFPSELLNAQIEHLIEELKDPWLDLTFKEAEKAYQRGLASSVDMERPLHFGEAADYYGTVAEKLKGTPEADTEDGRKLLVYCRVHQASCLQECGGLDQEGAQHKAFSEKCEAIMNDIGEVADPYDFYHYRRAFMHSHRGELEKALESIELARQRHESAKGQNGNRALATMSIGIPRYRGFIEYCLGERALAAGKKRDAFEAGERAYNATLSAQRLEEDLDLRSIWTENNLIWFAQWLMKNATSPKKREQYREALTGHMEKIQKDFSGLRHARHSVSNHLHTLMTAHDTLGNLPDAKKLAQRIAQLYSKRGIPWIGGDENTVLNDTIGFMLPEKERGILADVRRILAKEMPAGEAG
jgi:ppGpp synthetase/RelA/SpoT-type nucleotidyltranferase